MKKLLTILAIVIANHSFSQCVEVDRFFTAGIHYLTNNRAKGFQLEVGSTGSESNFSYYAIVTAFKENNVESEKKYPDMVFGLKGAYRFIRVENLLNVYATTAIGEDIVYGFYNSTSVKILTVLGGKVALSLEPSYLTIQKAFITQAGINIILD